MRKIFILLIIIFFSMNVNSKPNFTIEEINDFKVFKNRNLSENDYKIQSLNERFKIEGTNNSEDSLAFFASPLAADEDNVGNIFIMDKTSLTIKKFDNNGKFVISFGGKGNGPGELQGVASMVVSSGKVHVVDFMKNAVVIFDLDGKYIKDTPLNNGFPMHLAKVGENKFIGIKDNYYEREGVNYSAKTLTLMNNEFNDLVKIAEFEFKQDGTTSNSMLDYLIPYAVSDDKIYISSNNEDNYTIDVYNFDGEKISEIRRDYRKVKMTKKESETFDDLLTKKNSGRKSPPLSAINKKAVNNIYCDKNDCLWVLFSIERNKQNEKDFIVDLYEDNILVDRFSLENFTGYDFFFLDDRYYFRNNDILHLKVSESTLNVYDFNSLKLK
ncbi:MAG: 6-bladed beta-propeller [Candidatus Delongbacteria bacterium]|nr:6-bladed beta-propeller [Candidatus Delongbacteria bacterium]MBN2835259.1 6-bladed beta-propeller [Candidatus Delongbacteria bacterium]